MAMEWAKEWVVMVAAWVGGVGGGEEENTILGPFIRN